MMEAAVGEADSPPSYSHPRYSPAAASKLIPRTKEDVFGVLPLREPLQIVRCRYCRKPIKDTHFRRHLFECILLLPHDERDRVRATLVDEDKRLLDDLANEIKDEDVLRLRLKSILPSSDVGDAKDGGQSIIEEEEVLLSGSIAELGHDLHEESAAATFKETEGSSASLEGGQQTVFIDGEEVIVAKNVDTADIATLSAASRPFESVKKTKFNPMKRLQADLMRFLLIAPVTLPRRPPVPDFSYLTNRILNPASTKAKQNPTASKAKNKPKKSKTPITLANATKSAAPKKPEPVRPPAKKKLPSKKQPNKKTVVKSSISKTAKKPSTSTSATSKSLKSSNKGFDAIASAKKYGPGAATIAWMGTSMPGIAWPAMPTTPKAPATKSKAQGKKGTSKAASTTKGSKASTSRSKHPATGSAKPKKGASTSNSAKSRPTPSGYSSASATSLVSNSAKSSGKGKGATGKPKPSKASKKTKAKPTPAVPAFTFLEAFDPSFYASMPVIASPSKRPKAMKTPPIISESERRLLSTTKSSKKTSKSTAQTTSAGKKLGAKAGKVSSAASSSSKAKASSSAKSLSSATITSGARKPPPKAARGRGTTSKGAAAPTAETAAVRGRGPRGARVGNTVTATAANRSRGRGSGASSTGKTKGISQTASPNRSFGKAVSPSSGSLKGKAKAPMATSKGGKKRTQTWKDQLKQTKKAKVLAEATPAQLLSVLNVGKAKIGKFSEA